MNKTVLVADKDINNYVGGAELDDACLIKRLKTQVDFKTCDTLNNEEIDLDTLYIISNFTSLSSEKKAELVEKGTYVIYEKDFKLCKARIPDVYQSPFPFLPFNSLHNIEFYEAAKYVICITMYQEEIYKANLNVNTININGVLFSDEELDLIEKYIDSPKLTGRAYIFMPKNHLNLSVEYAARTKIPCDMINQLPREEFLKTISQYDHHIFITNITESCSRQAIENKIFNTQVISGSNVGVLHEPWYTTISPGRPMFLYVKNEMIPSIINKFEKIIKEF